MKNIFTKIITTFVVFTALVLMLKVGDNMLAKASTSNIYDQCGVNNGWSWNGTQCVNYCDQNHPWDSVNHRCSVYTYGNNVNYTYLNNYNYSGNCLAYGSNFYWNGSYCIQIVPGQNISYANTNPYNGNGYTYINNTNTNQNVVYVDSNEYSNTCYDSCWQDPAPKVITKYYVYTQTSYPQSYNNYNYSNNYPYYTYLGSTDSQYYNDYLNCNYKDYTNVGYYDIYGHYYH